MSDMTMPELIVSLHKRITKDGKRIAELEAERDEAMATMYHERGDREQAEDDAREWADSFKQAEAALVILDDCIRIARERVEGE